MFYYFYQAAIAVKISNLLICFCSFDLSCPILEKYFFIENFDIILSCLVKWRSFLTLFVSREIFSIFISQIVCVFEII